MPPHGRKQHAKSFLFLYILGEVTKVQFKIGDGTRDEYGLPTGNIEIKIWQAWGSEKCVVSNLVREKTTFASSELIDFGQAHLQDCYKFAIFKNPNKGTLKFKISVKGVPDSWKLAYVKIILDNGQKYKCGNNIALRADKAGDNTNKSFPSSRVVDCREE